MNEINYAAMANLNKHWQQPKFDWKIVYKLKNLKFVIYRL